MRKACASALLVALVGTALIGTSAGYTLRNNSSVSAIVPATPGSNVPQLATIQILFHGDPVDQIVSGKKIKKYSLELTGSDFVPGSSAVVNSVRAYPYSLDRPEQPANTIYGSSTSLMVGFLPADSPPPGLLSVRVTSPDGLSSNTLTIDVVSKGAQLSIASIFPQSGPIGTQVTLSGVGFATTETAIRFSRIPHEIIYQTFDVDSDFAGFNPGISSADQTLTFAVPSSRIVPLCPGLRIPHCDPLAGLQISSQQYRVQVINPNGMSNSVLFEVTSR